jgi:branched-chain amino acid transport system permease protein
MRAAPLASPSRRVTGVLLLISAAVVLPWLAPSEYFLSLLIPGLIYAAPCIGWTAIFRTGQISLGQASFMTIGGYCSALLAINLNWSAWIAMPAGGLVAALVAWVVGVIVLRIGGFYFCVVTLSMTEILRIAATNWTDVTNGTYGLIPPPPVLEILGYSVEFATSRVPYYYLALALLVVTALVFWRLHVSRVGRAFRAVADNPVLASHLGIRLMKYRVMAYTIAGFFTGVAGALYGQYLFVVNPSLFALPESFLILIMCVVGGVRYPVLGPVLGAVLLSATGDYLTTISDGARPLALGLLVVTVVFVLPDGLASLRWRRGGREEVPGSNGTPAEGQHAAP